MMLAAYANIICDGVRNGSFFVAMTTNVLNLMIILGMKLTCNFLLN